MAQNGMLERRCPRAAGAAGDVPEPCWRSEMVKRICLKPDCGRPVLARGLCGRHYQQYRNSPEWQPMEPLTVEQRFWMKVTTQGSIPPFRPDLGPCYEWTGGKGHGGYALFHPVAGVSAPAYRWIYEQENGAVPKGLELDHLCRNPGCVRPSHLEAVTHLENVRRGVDAYELKDTCRRGHSMIGVTPSSDGYRHCLACRRLTWRARRGRT